MERKTKGRADFLLRARKKKKLWLRAASAMAAIVVFATTYALILPAITLSGQYTCGLEEHVHTDEDGCYTEQAVQTLACALDIHRHTDDCKDENQNLICGYADFVAHAHSDLCYSNGALVCTLEERKPHEHTAECFESVLTCGQEADEGHTHGDACQELICGQEESEEHSHSEACDTLVCGQEQCEGHTHTDACYTLEQTCEKEEILLHTHTAENGCFDAHGNLTCEKLQIQEHTHTGSCFQTVQEKTLICDRTEHTHSGECLPAVDEEQEQTTPATQTAAPLCGKEPHVHDSDCYAPAAEGGERLLICEQAEHTHSEECYASEETQPEGRAYVCQEDSLMVSVALPEGSTVPPDAELIVQPITESAQDYETLVSQAEAVSGEAVSICFYEIGFRTQAGEYLPVSEEARVTIRFLNPLEESGEAVTVLHYAEGTEEPIVLNEVAVQRDENDALSELTFQTDGFSVFAVVTADTPQAQTDPGNTFTLTYDGHTITFSVVDTAGNPIAGNYTNITAEADTLYKFEGKGGIAPEIEGHIYSGANLESNVVVSVATKKDNNSFYGRTFRLYKTDPIESGEWYSEDDASVTLTYVNNGIDYSGEWMIVNLKSNFRNGVAMLADGINGNDNANRAGRTVTVMASGESKYVMDSAVTHWKFEKQTDGTYYISTMVNGTKQYLTIGGTANDPVTLSETAQNITVSEGTGTYTGMVRLTNGSGMAVNLFGANAAQGFGSYSDNSANEWQTLCKAVGTGNLLYDLAVTTSRVGTHIINGTNWEEVPELMTVHGEGADAIQEVTADGVSLYGPGTPGENGYFTFVGINGEMRQEIRQVLGNAGKEFRFDGWQATDVEGEACLFAKNATAALENDGIHITDVDGVERVLASGATLTAQWTQVSDIALFFVNYSGTILDTEGNVSGRNQKEFTGIIGIGRIYYGKEQAGTDTEFASDADLQIRADFVHEFDPDNPNPQLVMEYVTAYDENVTSNSTATDPQNSGAGYALYKAAKGINDTELETALLQFIRDNDNVSIKVSTADNLNNPVIENENSTPDNYSVRWYVMKDQADAWHIDGVMVAKTAEITVTKTFSGLTDTQVAGILKESSRDGYQMPVALGTNQGPYIMMTTQPVYNGNDKDGNSITVDERGQYNYYGQEKTGGQSYTWILNAITDEQYTLSETRYELVDYDVSTIVVNYYTDDNGQTQVVSGFDSTTESLSKQVIGGKTTAVSFNNFYTPTGTGAFAIHKSAENRTGEGDVGSALQGAEFTLYTDEDCKTVLADDGGNEFVSTTNSRGSAYFSNLETGIYYMQETKAPKGYFAGSTVWRVKVENSDNGIKVTVYDNGNKNDPGTVCYDGGITKSYVIQNTPEVGTVRITKTFSGLTAVEMEQIVQNSKKDGAAPYYIRLQGNVGADGVVDANKDTLATLYLQDAARGQDGFTFTWMVANLAMTTENAEAITYQISEYNYLIDDFQETVVTAQVNGQPKKIAIDRDLESVDFSTTFNPDTSDRVMLANHYTNTFTLTLQKMDQSKARLPGAVFDIYGPYRESKDTSRYIAYKDPKTGRTRTAYFIQMITANDDGIATMEGLNLSGEDNTFVYVINESFAPEGYAKLDEPIVQSVTLDAKGYFNGVYTTDVINIKKEDYVHRTLDTEKVWEPAAPDGAEVTLELYRVSHARKGEALEDVADAVRVAKVTLDGKIDTAENNPDSNKMLPGEGQEQMIYAYEAAPWTVTWGNLPAADAEDYENSGVHYHYFVREVTVDGFATAYTCYDEKGTQPADAFQTLRGTDENGSLTGTFQGVLLADMDEAYTVGIINTVCYELPATGGSGTTAYLELGAFVMLAAVLTGLGIEKRSKRGGAGHS